MALSRRPTFSAVSPDAALPPSLIFSRHGKNSNQNTRWWECIRDSPRRFFAFAASIVCASAEKHRLRGVKGRSHNRHKPRRAIFVGPARLKFPRSQPENRQASSRGGNHQHNLASSAMPAFRDTTSGMNNSDTALWRYSVIAPLLHRGPGETLLDAARREAAGMKTGPDNEPTTVSMPTILRWYRAWQFGGLEALERRERNDRGETRAMDEKAVAVLLDLAEAHPEWTVRAIPSPLTKTDPPLLARNDPPAEAEFRMRGGDGAWRRARDRAGFGNRVGCLRAFRDAPAASKKRSTSRIDLPEARPLDVDGMALMADA
jgi:hypothetical protein